MRDMFSSEHRKARRLLSAYIDERLSAREARWLEAHLEACPSCQEELRTLRMTVELLRALPAVAPSRFFVLTEASVHKAPFAWVWTPLRGATAVVALLLSVTFALDLWRQETMKAAPSPAQVEALRPRPSPPAVREEAVREAAVATPEPVRETIVAERALPRAVEKPVERVVGKEVTQAVAGTAAKEAAKETVVVEGKGELMAAPAYVEKPTPSISPSPVAPLTAEAPQALGPPATGLQPPSAALSPAEKLPTTFGEPAPLPIPEDRLAVILRRLELGLLAGLVLLFALTIAVGRRRSRRASRR